MADAVRRDPTSVGSYVVSMAHDVSDVLEVLILLREVGRGGAGVVYRAEHKTLKRPVAIKVLRPDQASDQERIARLFLEARAASIEEFFSPSDA